MRSDSHHKIAHATIQTKDLRTNSRAMYPLDFRAPFLDEDRAGQLVFFSTPDDPTVNHWIRSLQLSAKVTGAKLMLFVSKAFYPGLKKGKKALNSVVLLWWEDKSNKQSNK